MSPPLPHVDGIAHRDVTVHGIRLHVAEGGPPDAPAVVLLHGWPQHWWMWRDVLGPLARDRRVIAPDLRGLGWSDAPPGGYRKQQLADDVLALLDALELDRVDLIGHDWGGIVGFLMCLTAPDRVGSFLACSIPHLWAAADGPSLRQATQLWYQVVLAAPGLGQALMRHGEATRRVLRAARTHGTYTDEELRCFVDVLRQPARARATTQYYRTFLLRELGPIMRGAYADRRLRTPTRMLWGTRDPILRGARDTPPRANAPALEIEWVPDTGHFLPEERPELVVARARALMAG